MFQAPFLSHIPQTPDDLAASRDRLAAAVARHAAGLECHCAMAVRDALAGVERGLRRRIALDDAADGPCPEIDSTRATLARQADGLHQRRWDLLAQTVAVGEAVADGADLGDVRRAAEELLVGLQAIETTETDLVLESVNTDLGVGD
jgi:hypothetical protein